jgi:hypothetical protein
MGKKMKKMEKFLVKLHVFNWLYKVLDLQLKWEKNEKMEKFHVNLHVFNWLFKVLDLKLK